MALCGHLEPWLETWPAWGMAAGGVVFALPTPAPLTDGSACSSLPTPRAQAREHLYPREDYRHNLEEAIGWLDKDPTVNPSSSARQPLPCLSGATTSGITVDQSGSATLLNWQETQQTARSLTSAPTPPPSDAGNTS